MPDPFMLVILAAVGLLAVAVFRFVTAPSDANDFHDRDSWGL